MSININNNVNQININKSLINDENKTKSNNEIKKNLSSNINNQTIITISKESRDSYRKKIQESSNHKKTYEDIIKTRNSIKEASKSITVDFGYELSKEVGKLKEQRTNNNTYSLSNRAEDYVKAYANLYDEIVQGYKNGTREFYVEDENSETGYRKMTMEEELNNLDKAYQKQAHMMDIFAQNTKNAASAFNSAAEKLSKINVSMANTYRTQAQTKDIPENIGQNMINIAQKWKDSYISSNSKYNSMEDILSIIKNNLYVSL